jgi:hypothetical protein
MIKKWVKILPYWLVMKFCRRFNASWGTFGDKKIKYFQIDEGEFVMFSPEIQEIFDKREREKKKEKINKKKEKIEKLLNKDSSLKEEIHKELNYEEEREREDFELGRE